MESSPAGDVWRRLGHYVEARDMYVRARKDPRQTDYLLNIGHTYYEMRKWEEAIKFYQQQIDDFIYRLKPAKKKITDVIKKEATLEKKEILVRAFMERYSKGVGETRMEGGDEKCSDLIRLRELE